MKKYQIIYADPPWKYRDTAEYKKFRPNGMGASFHYPVMTTGDICKLNIPSDNNAILFLWATTPFLEDGFKVINAWGYKYKTALYWDKVNLGTGHYFRGQVEVLLVGIKGKIKAFHKQN
jgi:N6-adenosine-specific RNA methylase IME4